LLASWDGLVEKVPGSDVSQLSAWAEVRRAAGFEPLYAFARDGAELVGGALVLRRKVPFVGDVGYVPYGPVVAVNAEREAVVAALATGLREVACRTRGMLFIQPPLGGEDISLELQRQRFRRSNAGIAPAASLRLDLARSEDELRAGLRKRLRTWTRSWPKRGVGVRRGTADDMALFARLHATTAQYQGFTPLSLEYLSTLYERLAPAGHAELFVGEIDCRPVAARLYSGCGSVLKLRLAGMDRDDEAARLSVPAAVEWEAIRWAKANGYQWFDFGGIKDSALSILEVEGSDSPALRGIDAFKATFGGTPFRYPRSVEMISSPVVRIAYDLSRRWPVGRRLVERTGLRIGGRAGGGGTSQEK
jgi:lipid II:glycine glycyltransferase (peptidoglycan interpeptide bridge formation enzyme)